MARILANILAVAAAFLLTLNLVGGVVMVYHSWTSDFAPQHFLGIVERPFTSRQEYVQRLTNALHHVMKNVYMPQNSHAFRVPPWENYLFFIQGLRDPANYNLYEFCDDRKALLRGIGLCSQQSNTLARFLSSRGIETVLVTLGGHVVVMARVDSAHDTWWTLDPDYGVVMPLPVSAVETQPDRIRPYYLAAGYTGAVLGNLVNIYGKQGNFTSLVDEDYFYDRCIIEKQTYALKWLIPFVMLLPWMLLQLLRRRRIQ